MNIETIKKQMQAHYNEKISTHGATFGAVDWGSETAQTVRFEQLLRVFPSPIAPPPVPDGNLPRLLDFGCGYGAFYRFLKEKLAFDFHFTGYDVLDEMIEVAKINFPENRHLIWTNELKDSENFDFIVESGAFNIKNGETNENWTAFVLENLDLMHQKARQGFAFNLLSQYSDPSFRRDYLYYADPLFFFDYCKTHYSPNVALLHDYGHWDFTIVVRK